jgi:hypothetical protein
MIWMMNSILRKIININNQYNQIKNKVIEKK